MITLLEVRPKEMAWAVHLLLNKTAEDALCKGTRPTEVMPGEITSPIKVLKKKVEGRHRNEAHHTAA